MAALVKCACRLAAALPVVADTWGWPAKRGVESLYVYCIVALLVEEFYEKF